MENIDSNIQKWELKFNKYCEYELKCHNYINSINDIKKNLNYLVGMQEKDDMIFYQSLINNSYFYLSKSLKIRIIKFIKDLNLIWKRIVEDVTMDELNKNNFMALLKDYRKLAESSQPKKNANNNLIWVKDDKIENLHNIENDINDIMVYHLKLISSFLTLVEVEKNFYCGESAHISNNFIINEEDLEETY